MSEGRDPRADRDRPDWSALAMLSTVGLTLALSIGIGIGLGVLIDRWLHTKGIAVIIGALLGVTAGFRELISVVRRANREEEARNRRDGDSGRNE